MNNNQTPIQPSQDMDIQTQQTSTTDNSQSIRHVIKLQNDDSSSSEKEEAKDAVDQPKEEKAIKKEINDKKKKSESTQDKPQETLQKQIEEKKEYLKQIKEFDFRINENKKQIEEFTKEISQVNENLDDLVSLYEIVSEQMNPFVGLSGVTKKRIEALENYTNEIEELKSRMMEIESGLVQPNQTRGSQKQENIPQPIKPKKQEITQSPKIERKNAFQQESKPVNLWDEDISDDDLDQIIEKSLDDIHLDKEIDQKIMKLFDSMEE